MRTAAFHLIMIALVAALFLPASVAAAGKTTDPATAREMFIDVPPFSVPMYHRGQLKGSMTVVLKIKLEDRDKRATAREQLPRLSSVYVMESNRLSHGFFDVRRPVDIVMLGDAFQKVTDQTLKHAEARVFIADVVVHER